MICIYIVRRGPFVGDAHVLAQTSRTAYGYTEVYIFCVQVKLSSFGVRQMISRDMGPKDNSKSCPGTVATVWCTAPFGHPVHVWQFGHPHVVLYFQ